MAPVTNVNRKPIRIAKKGIVSTWKDCTDYIVYPYEKAVCQGVLVVMPQLESEEVSYEDLKKMESARMTGKLGSSGK